MLFRSGPIVIGAEIDGVEVDCIDLFLRGAACLQGLLDFFGALEIADGGTDSVAFLESLEYAVAGDEARAAGDEDGVFGVCHGLNYGLNVSVTTKVRSVHGSMP